VYKIFNQVLEWLTYPSNDEKRRLKPAATGTNQIIVQLRTMNYKFNRKKCKIDKDI